jgi:hypothetical protein
MRLIDTATLQMGHVFNADRLQYAVLSHTWGDQEVTFQEFSNLNPSIMERSGYQKIKNCCQRAFTDGIKYCWIDTVCIDKTSSSELSESINCRISVDMA